MSNTQYAVCHLQRGSGNDSGMSCHIERKDAKGKKYVPDNADAGRTHLNRELVRFPEGVSNRTEAIQHRIDTAGLRRKVGKNQTKAIRVILTGTHEQMMEIANGGRLDSWIDANLKWLRETFGNENLVSACCTWTRKRHTCTPPSFPLSPGSASAGSGRARGSMKRNPVPVCLQTM